MSWTEERVDQLKKLWAEGLSASQIARTMGGVTRNAVIGKVHRLGLSGRITTTRSDRPRYTPHPRPRPRQVVPVQDVMDDPEPAPGEFSTVLALNESICKWPLGNPGEEGFRFCGRKATDDAPYCLEHTRKAYQPSQPKRDRSRERERIRQFNVA